MFRGETEAQFVAWLKAILASKLAEATQTHIVTQKRSVKRERSFEAGDAIDSGARDGIAVFEGKEESPSAAAMRGESAVTLAQAMEQLSERQYEAIRLRYIEGRSLSSIAESMESTEYAVAGLLKRGLVGLRGLLPGEVGQ
jgi:RNA polymerase sigma-70 factor (ECF subfamily)